MAHFVDDYHELHLRQNERALVSFGADGTLLIQYETYMGGVWVRHYGQSSALGRDRITIVQADEREESLSWPSAR